MADLSEKTKETLLPTQSEEGLHEDAASATRRSWRKSTDTLLFINVIVVSCIWLYHKAGLYTASQYQPDGLEAQDASPFAWRRCPHSKDDRWRCGRLHVPMDYLNKSDHRTFQLETVLFSPSPDRKAERTIQVHLEDRVLHTPGAGLRRSADGTRTAPSMSWVGTQEE